MSDGAVQPEEPQRCGSSLIGGRTDFGMEIIDPQKRGWNKTSTAK
jgi:hypothetical protein